MKWTNMMVDELSRATEHYELICDEEIAECTSVCEKERDQRISQAKIAIENDAQK